MSPDNRYGPFGVLDSRSEYGLGVLPEPFLVDDSDPEVNEFRFDVLDTRSRTQHVDLFKTELEKGFGPATVELELLYERDVSAGTVSAGVNSTNLGARVPNINSSQVFWTQRLAWEQKLHCRSILRAPEIPK
jgi:hypothetical protein